MWLDSFLTHYRAWRAYRRNLAELQSLDQRELDELGIGRWRLEGLARKDD